MNDVCAGRDDPARPSLIDGSSAACPHRKDDHISVRRELCTMSKTVVVLGAGVGGLTVASRLRERLPDKDRILLIDRSFDGTLGLSLLWIMRGWRTPEDVRVRPASAALPGIEMITA